MRYRFLLGCLILSGFAGLAYELLWVRLLALSFGSTAASFSTVLAVFFGGLAIGSLLGGRLAKRVRRPVRAYALVELGTGIAALVLYPLLVGLESAFAQFDPGPGTFGTVLRFIVAALVLIIPTVLMGATLPFVTRAMVDKDDDVGRVTALIYAFNTGGACLGAYVTTFWFLPYLGVFWATMFTVVINVLVFALASGFGRNERPLVTDEGSGSSVGSSMGSKLPRLADPQDDKLKLVGTALAMMLGFAGVALQVVWVRIFATAMQGTVYGTGSVLIAVLVGIGTGSLVLAPFIKRSPRAGLGFVALQVVGLGLVLLQFQLLPWISYELSSLQIQRLSLFGLHLQMVIVVLAVLGPSVCSGASLPLIVGIVESRAAQSARTVGNVYASNTIGAILGSLLTGFVVLPYAGSEAAVLLAVIALAGAAAFGALFLLDAPRPLRLATVPVGLVLASFYTGYDVQLLSVGPQSGSYAQWFNTADQIKQATVTFSEAKTSNVRVTASRGSWGLTLNGLGQGGRSEAPPHHIRESLLMAVVPLSHAKKKERALLVGLGAGVTADAMLKLGVERLKIVELEPKVVDAVGVIFQDVNPLDSERVDVVVNDARHYLNVQRMKDSEKYDLIASMPAHPWIASPIFTQDFFRIAKDSLNPEGVFCSWFGLGKMDRHATDSLLRAFTSAFDNYVIYYISDHRAYYLVGSPSPIDVDPERYRAVFAHPIVAAHPPLKSPLYLPRHIVVTGRAGDLPTVRPGPINTDDRPIVEMLSPTTTPTSGLASRDLFSPRGLDPNMVAEGARPEFVLELLEDLLGTPKSRLPFRVRRARPDLAAPTLARAKSEFDQDTIDYLELRLAIAKNRTAKGLDRRVEALRSAEYRARARRALAWMKPPHSAARARALAALPPDPDVVFHQLFEVGAPALARLSADEPSSDSPLAWWLWNLAHGEGLDEDGRQRLAELGPTLASTGNEPLLRLSAARAQAAGLPHLARAILEWADKARITRIRYHLRAGNIAGRRQDFRAAADHLWQAFSLDPTNRGLRMPLVQSLVELGDEARIRQVGETLRFQGMSKAQVTHLIQEANRRTKAGDGEGPAKAATAPNTGAPPEATGT